MSDRKESTCTSQGRTHAAEERCQRNGDYRGGSRKDHVPRYHKQHYCPREKRTEQKRPNDGALEGDEVVTVDDILPSPRKAKKHTTSLNHLLNFTLSPRETPGTVGSLLPQTRRRSQVQCYNKEQYLQANCQFVVSASGDYTVCTSDTDVLVDWDKIAQVRLFCHQIPSCPICLYLPRAAQITRCGHVYCWSCVLHYLELSDKKWRKCPICHESIYKKDLKSVVALESRQYHVNDVLRMKLMKRCKGTNYALPKPQWCQEVPGRLFPQDTAGGHFLKLLRATPAQVLAKIIRPERVELEAILCGLGSDEASEKPFVEKALEELTVREDMFLQAIYEQKEVKNSMSNQWPHVWGGHAKSPRPDNFEKPFSSSGDETDSLSTSPDSPVQSCGKDSEKNLLRPQSSTIESEDQDSVQQLSGSSTKEELVETTSIAAASTSSQGDFVFFYQASDGQHLYLHPVNAKCLIKQYGSLENGPEEIEARLLQMEQMSMTEEIRRRFRYLSHLPVTCEFALCELGLEPPTVSRATLDCYHGELERRHVNRQRKEQEELRLEKKLSVPSPSSMIVSDDGFFPLGSSCGYTPEECALPLFDVTNLKKQVSEEGQKDGPDAPPAPSFADALRSSSTKPPPPPSWPARHKVDPIRRVSSDDQEIDEKVSSVPSYQESFNSGLTLSPEPAVIGSSGKEEKALTKKKGRKKLVLFTTGGTRGN